MLGLRSASNPSLAIQALSPDHWEDDLRELLPNTAGSYDGNSVAIP